MPTSLRPPFARPPRRLRSTWTPPTSGSSDCSNASGFPVSDFEVTPVVALAHRRPVLAASPDEVARIVEPPVALFLPGAAITIVERTIREWPLRYGSYDVDGLSVWGATARILSQLGAVLAD